MHNPDFVLLLRTSCSLTKKIMPRPAIGLEERLVAWLTPEHELQVVALHHQYSTAVKTTTLRLSASIHGALPTTRLLKWSSSIRGETGDGSICTSVRLMLCTNHRVIVLELAVPEGRTSSIEATDVVADVEFPGTFGKICSADFVFDHDSVILVFELAPQASILSLTQAQRDDIPNRKFASSKGYTIARRESGAATSILALLVREKHTDQVVVLERGMVVSTFEAETTDAQGILWSPDESPMLLVWDSSSFGTKVNFFSAFGHPLRQLAIGPETSVPAALAMDFSGIGVSALDWVRKAESRSTSTLAIGNGSKQIHIRSQDTHSFAVKSSVFQHLSVLHSKETILWQHIGHDEYRSINGTWDVEMTDNGDVEALAISPDGHKVASKLSGCPKLAYVWDVKLGYPAAAIIFQHEVRQMLWQGPSDLLILTADRTPCFHHCQGFEQAPSQLTPPRLRGTTSGAWSISSLSSPQPTLASATAKISLLLMSSSKYIDIVNLGVPGYSSVFKDVAIPEGHEPPLDLSSETNSVNGRTMLQDSSRTSAGSSMFF